LGNITNQWTPQSKLSSLHLLKTPQQQQQKQKKQQQQEKKQQQQQRQQPKLNGQRSSPFQDICVDSSSSTTSFSRNFQNEVVEEVEYTPQFKYTAPIVPSSIEELQFDEKRVLMPVTTCPHLYSLSCSPPNSPPRHLPLEPLPPSFLDFDEEQLTLKLEEDEAEDPFNVNWHDWDLVIE